MTDINDVNWDVLGRPPSPHDPASDPLAPAGLVALPLHRRRRVAARVLGRLAADVGLDRAPAVRRALELLDAGRLPDGQTAQRLEDLASDIGDRYAVADDRAQAAPADPDAKAVLHRLTDCYTVAVGLWYLTATDRSLMPEVTAIMEAAAQMPDGALDDLVAQAVGPGRGT